MAIATTEQCAYYTNIGITKRPHQIEAVRAAARHFNQNDRGQLILPCGAGKTLTALWIAEEMRPKTVLVMLPSLALIAQTLEEWVLNTQISPFNYMVICGDKTVDDDVDISELLDKHIRVTTDYGKVVKFLLGYSGPRFLFCTYQSSKVLIDAARMSGTVFDFAVFDESHRTAGQHTDVWGLTLSDDNVHIRKRLFMTATPRIHAPNVKKRASEEDIVIYSMDDHNVYGSPFYEMSFGEGIKQGLLSDYEIVTLEVNDEESAKIIRKYRKLLHKDKEYNTKTLVKQFALLKAIEQYGLKRVFTFHSSVKSASKFVLPSSRHGFKKVIDIFFEEKGITKDIQTFHVNGKMSSKERLDIMEKFESAEIGIISNARCLTEGVNIPDVDCVAFMDHKESIIDIVQASGRALRKSFGKAKGYIFVPLITKKGDSADKIAAGEEFNTIAKVVLAMSDQDARLQAEISELKIRQHRGEGLSHLPASFPVRILSQYPGFAEKLTVRLIDKISSSFDFGFGMLLKFKDANGHVNVPATHALNGFNLGSWVGHRRGDYKKGMLSNDRIKRLEEIGFVWDPFDQAFEEGFRHLVEFKHANGHANVPQKYITADGFNLGDWVRSRRGDYKKGMLSSDRIKRLEEIGFVWDAFDQAFEEGFKHLVEFKHANGHVNVPRKYITADGFNLGDWVGKRRGDYKKGVLSNDRAKRLEEIGFVWDPFDQAFEEGFKHLVEFKHANGHVNVPATHALNGFNLGIWVGHMRRNYKKGVLSNDRIKRLEEIGFVWDPFDQAFEEGFRHLVEFKHANGHVNVPATHALNGFNLGIWVGRRRGDYKKGVLSSDRAKRLEEIGFVWDPFDQAFEEGFRHLVEFKHANGHVNVPATHALNGFNLGAWVGNKRGDYKKGVLSSDRAKRLEEIGFVWDPFDQAFEEGFRHLVEFKHANGHVNVPKTHALNGFNLGAWVGSRRKDYKKGMLSSDRAKRLEEIGFVWDARNQIKQGRQN